MVNWKALAALLNWAPALRCLAALPVPARRATRAAVVCGVQGPLLNFEQRASYGLRLPFALFLESTQNNP